MAPTRPLTAEIILSTTEDVLRRHGPDRATVVDVARVLGVSHSAVYKHFSSKRELREAVTRRWLVLHRDVLAGIATDDRVPAPDRLRSWLEQLLAGKRARAQEEPELFAAFAILANENSSLAAEHVEDLLNQLRRMVADGMDSGAFRRADPDVTAQAVFLATSRFHHLAFAPEWDDPNIVKQLQTVCALLLDGLRNPAG